MRAGASYAGARTGAASVGCADSRRRARRRQHSMIEEPLAHEAETMNEDPLAAALASPARIADRRRDGEAPRDRRGDGAADVLRHLRGEAGLLRRRPRRAAGFDAEGLRANAQACGAAFEAA